MEELYRLYLQIPPRQPRGSPQNRLRPPAIKRFLERASALAVPRGKAWAYCHTRRLEEHNVQLG